MAPQGSKEALGHLDFKVKRELPAGLAYLDKQVFIQLQLFSHFSVNTCCCSFGVKKKKGDFLQFTVAELPLVNVFLKKSKAKNCPVFSEIHLSESASNRS